ncbi:unannotated protein [freshwater metagenome]|uniref:Unannotated protein n=1 Tax=freshwater metagenome TaxID=449393 RepID=A0A6J7GDW9_9ZZZZ|nr:hypothetical protein [Actinomycetota bacterium]
MTTDRTDPEIVDAVPADEDPTELWASTHPRTFDERAESLLSVVAAQAGLSEYVAVHQNRDQIEASARDWLRAAGVDELLWRLDQACERLQDAWGREQAQAERAEQLHAALQASRAQGRRGRDAASLARTELASGTSRAIDAHPGAAFADDVLANYLDGKPLAAERPDADQRWADGAARTPAAEPTTADLLRELARTETRIAHSLAQVVERIANPLVVVQADGPTGDR